VKTTRRASTLFALAVIAGTIAAQARADTLPPGVTYAADTDPVRITAVSFDPAHPSRGDTVDAQIICTSNAAAVTARVGTIVVNVPKKAPGIFRTTLQLPSLPFYSAHQNVVITAIRTDGAKTQRTISVELR
jgi:hypothetical protein